MKEKHKNKNERKQLYYKRKFYKEGTCQHNI